MLVDIMKLNVIESDAKSIIVEFEDADRGIAELIKDKVLESKDVEFAGVVKEHPQVGNPRLIVKAEKNAKGIVLKAVESLQDDLKELATQLPKK